MAPPGEQQICTNAWAFRHWAAATGRASLPDDPAIARWQRTDPAAWAEAVCAFAGPAFATSGTDPQALARVLLDADLRPDDRVIVAGTEPDPWVLARAQGTAVTLWTGTASEPLSAAVAAARATVVIAPAALLRTLRLPASMRPIDPSEPQTVLRVICS